MTKKKMQLYLPVSLGMATQARQGGQTQVTGPASGQCLHEQRLVGDKAHNSYLVMEQLWYKRGRVNVSLRHERATSQAKF